jgi:predicted transcriptional regulator
MACVNDDGTITSSGKAVIKAAAGGEVTPKQIADAAGLPLFRVRASLRELVEAGLISEADGKYTATADGKLRLAED